MRSSQPIVSPPEAETDRLARLEQRLARVETLLGIEAVAAVLPPGTERANEQPAALAPVFAARAATSADEFELEVGQNWFALAGITVLTAGIAFLLLLPYRGLPALAPAAGGVGFAVALLAVARFNARGVAAIATYLRGAAMIMLGIAGLRLFFFAPQPALEITGLGGRTVLLAIIAANLGIAIAYRSPGLVGAALATAGGLSLAVGAGEFVLPVLIGLAGITLGLVRRENWFGLVPVAQALSFGTYFCWAAGNPFRSGHVHFASSPAWSVPVLLVLIVAWGVAPLLQSSRRGDGAVNNTSALLNCLLGYGGLLVHTAAAFPTWFAAAHLVAMMVFLGLAVVFFVREQSRVATFFYAMTGYAALSAAILKLTHAPEVFVWLSVQSVVVVTTAIWFRSRFIVVANFFIFAAIVAAYVFLAERESGISIGFGLVALASARILHWQQGRLELKTGLMRNAYLVSAFFVFPYALYHLVPAGYVALAWVGLAGVYYVLNVAIRNQKYRWMGHATLGLTTLYVVSIGVSRFEPIYRVLSFLVLGTVLLIVSMSFARARRRED